MTVNISLSEHVVINGTSYVAHYKSHIKERREGEVQVFFLIKQSNLLSIE